ncbi:GntR family transcriptional regulator [Marinomonas sp. 15G1-11]|uniref:GntR family transcriptional regulator n=1 Tax=Marinomonas phaeophyticola TaxID=3004091 RepID=A0ABT4JRI1_9GAMM|nr:GntR family transcriptional regulator [Marinomonas sp. 15G1-11]MCZ2720980.1 GntR family transcriptional regulator [Marinomonas sp. 15G1-11]
MSRKNFLFQKSVNALLDILKNEYVVGDNLPSDLTIANRLDVSRSTARKTIDYMIEQGFIVKLGSQKTLYAMPQKSHYFAVNKQSMSKDKQVEEHFLNLILNGKIKPGDRFSELELARQSNCNTVTVREFLIRFSRFGLIEKSPRSQWQMKNFDEQFVDELYEVRHLFEMYSLSSFMQLEETKPHWQQLEALLLEHQEIEPHMEERFHEFPKLDQKFHTLMQSAQPNQFVSQFYDIISFVFHYHYQWDRNSEKDRNTVAVHEHIDIISKMLMKDYRGATLALEKHLNTAKESLKNTAIL